MPRCSVTVELESNLVEAARAVARRAGVPEGELYEQALREVLNRDFAQLLDEVAGYQAAHDVSLSDEEAMDLAATELRAVRAKRRSAL